MDVYKFKDYRELINHWSDSEGERGARSRLAQAAGSSPSWITRVLTGDVQMTPDQAMGVATYFGLNENETDYLLLLVDLERAATAVLKKRIQKKLDALKKESRKIAGSIKVDSTVTQENSARYYSSWVYAGVHVACMIKPQTVEEVSEALSLTPTLVSRTLRELREMGLVNIEGNRWIANSKNVHLPVDHPGAKFSHSIWRNKTIQFLHEGHDSGLHYSAIHCLSEADLEKIHIILKDTILNCRQVIAESPSESLAVFCLDWYKIQSP